MEKKIKQSIPTVTYDQINCNQLTRWIVEDFPNPSFWDPEMHDNFFKNKQKSNNKSNGDLIFDGLELETNEFGEIKEFGIMAYLFNIRLISTEINSFPSSICARVYLKDFLMGEPCFIDELGNQDIRFNKKVGLVQWYLDPNLKSDQYLKIADNVVVGVYKGKFNELLAKVH